ncbi:hypothetical protein GUJ93_ZPchr0011g28817 [Zizania palustris]|uniref:WRKY domain-containing protein n=1 Tax=Zizania palustris TaxID=103762 RepID=A0A8J6BPE1_ZIZPA|nr:hypothetical protein GUJ93_ZPchr0011g28817 [Zizania palustris]
MAAAALENPASVAAGFGGGDDNDEQVQSAVAEGAVREVAQVYELIKTHQPLLLLLQQPQQLAHNLLNQALRALNVALSVMKLHRQQHPPPAAAAPLAVVVSNSTKAEPSHLPSSSSSPLSSNAAPDADLSDTHAGLIKSRRAAKRRRINNGEDNMPSSWGHLTTVPYEDGYQWRKYGEKKIQGTSFTRSYFRCTYRDDKGCQATKQIQQKDNSDPPMFQVKYTKEHTCNFCTTAARIVVDSNNPTAVHNLAAAANIAPDARPDNDDAFWSNKMIKQEQPHADQLPTFSNNPDETPLYVCKDVPPLGHRNMWCITDNNTSVSGYTDEFQHQIGQQAKTMALEESLELGADLDYPCFSDLHFDLLLQYENFDHY